MKDENVITITIVDPFELRKVERKADTMLAAIERSVTCGIELLLKAYKDKLEYTKPTWFGLSRSKSFLECNGYTEVTEAAVSKFRKDNWLGWLYQRTLCVIRSSGTSRVRTKSR